MEWVTILNIAMPIIVAAVGWMAAQSEKRLDNAFKRIEFLEAANGNLYNIYARRDDVEKVLEYLRRIEDKLDRKADK